MSTGGKITSCIKKKDNKAQKTEIFTNNNLINSRPGHHVNVCDVFFCLNNVVDMFISVQ